MSSPLATQNVRVPHEMPAIVSDRAIDLVHLSRQSLGDRELESELLNLFVRQAEQIVEHLCSSMGSGDQRWRHDLSHTLKGSARAVGAGRVALAAEAYEEAMYAGRPSNELDACVARLKHCVEEAQTAIRDLLAEA